MYLHSFESLGQRIHFLFRGPRPGEKIYFLIRNIFQRAMENCKLLNFAFSECKMSGLRERSRGQMGMPLCSERTPINSDRSRHERLLLRNIFAEASGLFSKMSANDIWNNGFRHFSELSFFLPGLLFPRFFFRTRKMRDSSLGDRCGGGA